MEKRGRNIFYKFIVRTYQHEFIVTILDVQIDMNDAQCYFRSMAVCHHHVTFFDLIIFLLSVYRKCKNLTSSKVTGKNPYIALNHGGWKPHVLIY